MKYSKISTWRVKNFRNIGDITLDFTKSPIIALVGANEAGKTSLVKSFGVLGANTDITEQKEFIRDNTNGFGIACVLEDGTQINRIKTNLRNSIDIMKSGVSVYSIDKIDRGYGVPVELEKEMGLSVEPETGELLQIRTYEDNLLFVQTKGSENYKVMYNALKVDDISKAIKAGIKESNVIASSIKDLESGLHTLRETLKNTRVVDISTLVKVRDRIKENIELKDSLEKLTEFSKIIDGLSTKLELKSRLAELKEIELENVRWFIGLIEHISCSEDLYRERRNLAELDNLSEIDLSSFDKLNKLVRLSENLHHLNSKDNGDLRKLSEISLDSFNGMGKLLEKLDGHSELRSKLNVYSDLSDLCEMSQDSLDVMLKLNKLSGLVDKDLSLRSYVVEYKELSDKYYHLIKESGVCVADCPNCGNTVVLEQAM